MELGNSGLSSSIMQHYWQHVMYSYFHPSDDVRQEAANVIFQTQSQGLLTPGSAIPILIAMCTDRVVAIRNRIEALVKDIDSKYSGMVSSKAIAGIRQSFRLQSMIQQDPTEIIRGIRSIDPRPKNDLPTSSNDVQSMLNGLYACIRTNRQQRRNFLGSTLRLFSDHVEKVSDFIALKSNIPL
jgi:cohesin loading factor subunit SCC2